MEHEVELVLVEDEHEVTPMLVETVEVEPTQLLVLLLE